MRLLSRKQAKQGNTRTNKSDRGGQRRNQSDRKCGWIDSIRDYGNGVAAG